MSRSEATLESELNGLSLYGTEAAAITAWADAFANYFDDASTATGGTILTVVAAKAAMVAAMTGLSTAGAAAIASGISAFWAIGVATPAAWWATCTLVVLPVALASLQTNLAATFAQNISEGASKATCMGRIAGNIHTACSGGTATFPVPVVDPID